jgi:putative integral membrane protein (TIGR02587 family)
MSIREMLGKVALLTVPASIGAIMAQKQLGQGSPDGEVAKRTAHYGGELFLMAVGGLFFAFNVAPTEEMILIAHMMTYWHTLALVVISIVIMHALVYTVGFRGQEAGPPEVTFWRMFYHFTVVGYAIALLVSLYVLWTFGRLEGLGVSTILVATVVLAFPTALGAALSRLVL